MFRFSLKLLTVSELLGTLFVFSGFAVSGLIADFPKVDSGFKWFSLVIGFSVLTMIYAAGHRLGERLDPAAAVNLDTAKRIPVTYLLSYGASRLMGRS